MGTSSLQALHSLTPAVNASDLISAWRANLAEMGGGRHGSRSVYPRYFPKQSGAKRAPTSSALWSGLTAWLKRTRQVFVVVPALAPLHTT